MSERRPLIGITSYSRATSKTEREIFPIPTVYVEAVRAAGGTAIILPPGEPEPARLLDAFDGLVLSGGGDVGPENYDGDFHDAIYGVSEERDSFEIALAKAALAREDLPVLCICRGLQILNVALGGTLHPHLPDLENSTIEHRHPSRQHTHHAASVDPDSRLANLLGSNVVKVASWHHQAIDKLAPGLKAVSWAEDGIIEAVEHEKNDRVIAVQWHPEMQLDDPSQRRMLERFVDLCR